MWRPRRAVAFHDESRQRPRTSERVAVSPRDVRSRAVRDPWAGVVRALHGGRSARGCADRRVDGTSGCIFPTARRGASPRAARRALHRDRRGSRTVGRGVRSAADTPRRRVASARGGREAAGLQCMLGDAPPKKVRSKGRPPVAEAHIYLRSRCASAARLCGAVGSEGKLCGDGRVCADLCCGVGGSGYFANSAFSGSGGRVPECLARLPGRGVARGGLPRRSHHSSRCAPCLEKALLWQGPLVRTLCVASSVVAWGCHLSASASLHSSRGGRITSRL